MSSAEKRLVRRGVQCGGRRRHSGSGPGDALAAAGRCAKARGRESDGHLKRTVAPLPMTGSHGRGGRFSSPQENVEVVGQVGVVDGALMGAQRPPFDARAQGNNPRCPLKPSTTTLNYRFTGATGRSGLTRTNLPIVPNHQRATPDPTTTGPTVSSSRATAGSAPSLSRTTPGQPCGRPGCRRAMHTGGPRPTGRPARPATRARGP